MAVDREFYVYRFGRPRPGRTDGRTVPDGGRTGGRTEGGRADGRRADGRTEGRRDGRTEGGRADGRAQQYNDDHRFSMILNDSATIFIDVERF